MGNKITIFSFTETGSRQNVIISEILSRKGYQCESYTVERFAEQFHMKPLAKDQKKWIGQRWGQYSFVFIGAVGIAVRNIAPWVADKYTDSAVLCIDEKGKFVIPVLSGHMGGAVKLAGMLANELDAAAVITTATDLQNKFAVDVFAKENHLSIASRKLAKEISAAVLRNETVGFYSSFPVKGHIPGDLYVCSSFEELCRQPLGIAVMDAAEKEMKKVENILYLIPQNLVIGIGCRKGVKKEHLKQKLEELLGELDVSGARIEAFVSIELKQDETGILELAKEYKAPFITYTVEELREVEVVSSHSKFVEQITGVDNVCERAAKRYAPAGVVIQQKIKMDGVTYAVVKNKVRPEL